VIYERSLEIERRLAQVIDLIQHGRHSTRSLAETLRVSIPTVSRCLAAVRERGHRIEARKSGGEWHYVYLGRKAAHGEGRRSPPPTTRAGTTNLLAGARQPDRVSL
jgi:transposase